MPTDPPSDPPRPRDMLFAKLAEVTGTLGGLTIAIRERDARADERHAETRRLADERHTHVCNRLETLEQARERLATETQQRLASEAIARAETLEAELASVRADERVDARDAKSRRWSLGEKIAVPVVLTALAIASGLVTRAVGLASAPAIAAPYPLPVFLPASAAPPGDAGPLHHP